MAERKLNLDLAFRRVRDELVEQPKSGRAFVANPFELALAEVDIEAWLRDIGARVEADAYVPGAIQLAGAPKPGDLIRPAARITLEDRVVYTAALGACLKEIVAATRWSQSKVDFAPSFDAKHTYQRRWLRKPFTGWAKWTEQSVGKLEKPSVRHVVTVDIAGYFENISITLLHSELNRIGCPTAAIDLITKCLRSWAQVPERGLPQGVLASDILAKLYLESFDKRMKDEGYTHYRYVDDIRIFCRNETEAKRALVLATELLRVRGLTVQSAKTGIREVNDDLKKEFAGSVPTIKALNKEYIDEAIEAAILPASEESVPVSVIDELVNVEPDSMDPEVIRRAFTRFVIDVDRPNRSMFRYLLRRFAASGDNFAVAYCAAFLVSAPDAAPEILRYFEDLHDARELEKHVRKVLESKQLEMYPYTRFLLLGWILRNCVRLRKPTLKAVRYCALRPESPDYVQAEARAVIGALGEDSDLEALATALKSTTDPFKRAQLLCCLQRLERSRRNALVAAMGHQRPWGKRAGVLAKGESHMDPGASP
jgi:Reverse transcriptase (RNA-dependent DNA polymerase)